MHIVLILTAALAICAQAVPQFNNNFGSRNLGLKAIFRLNPSQTDNENQNQNNGVIPRGIPLQLSITGHRRPNDQGQQMQKNNRGNSAQCWDFMSNTYRDSAANIPSTNQFLSQFYNGHFLGQNNFNIPVIPCFTSANYWATNQPSHGHGQQHNHGHGPAHDHGHGHGPPHDHGHGHGSPHDHGHGHGPPHNHGHGHGPPHDHGHGHGPPHNHGHGHGPPHDHEHGHGPPHDHGHGHGPPHDHGHGNGRPNPNYGSERPPLPPRPPHRPHHETVYKLEICEESCKENVSPENVETTTIGGGSSVVSPHDSSSPIALISSSVIPEDERSPESVTQSTINRSVKTTTEFDWNNYFIGASADNTGAVGSIDIRGGGITAV